jgi:hypothetical protein
VEVSLLLLLNFLGFFVSFHIIKKRPKIFHLQRKWRRKSTNKRFSFCCFVFFWKKISNFSGWMITHENYSPTIGDTFSGIDKSTHIQVRCDYISQFFGENMLARRMSRSLVRSAGLSLWKKLKKSSRFFFFLFVCLFLHREGIG